jgi:hypothetical protein
VEPAATVRSVIPLAFAVQGAVLVPAREAPNQSATAHASAVV